MSATFTCYIDESGDPGFTFRPLGERGSSRWMFVGALVIKTPRIPQLILDVEGWRGELGMAKHQDFHFHRFTHERRIATLQRIAKLHARFVVVGLNKERLPKMSARSATDQVYLYASRFILERISWLCRDENPLNPSADVIFSARGGLNIPRVQNYLSLIKAGDNSIEWACIDPSRLDVQPNECVTGLQLADSIVSGTRWGIQADDFGNVETRYIYEMRRKYYRYLRADGTRELVNYGLKLYPESLYEMRAANLLIEDLPL